MLIDRFRITKRVGLKGLKHVHLNAPKDSKIRTTYIRPVNLVEETMDKFSATISQKDEVKELESRVVELESSERCRLQDAGYVDDAAPARTRFEIWNHEFGQQCWMNHIDSHQVIHFCV